MDNVEKKAILETTILKNEEDYRNAVHLTKLLFTPFGLWPIYKSKIYQYLVRPVIAVVCVSIFLFMAIPLGTFMIFKVNDLKVHLKLIGPLNFSLINLFKYLIILMRKRKLADCLHRISQNWQEVSDSFERSIMLRNAKNGRMLTLMCLVLMYSAGMPFAIILPISRGSSTIGNVTYRHLPYPHYYIFFNPNVRPFYDFIFALQCIGAFLRYTTTCAVNSFIIICVVHICGCIDAMTLKMKKIVDEPDFNWINHIMRKNVELLDFAALIEDIFKEIVFVDMLGSTSSICFLGYSFITEYEDREAVSSISFIILLTSFTFNIFIQCYIGELLTNQCESIGKFAYTINWYQLPTEESRNMVMLISRGQRPVVLTAGKMAPLSIQTFSSIMKASASYLNLLRTVTTV